MLKRTLLDYYEKTNNKICKTKKHTPKNQPIGPITAKNFSEWFDKAINYVNRNIIPNSTKNSKHQLNLDSVQNQGICSINVLKDLFIRHEVFSEPDALIIAIRYINDLSKKLTITDKNYLILWYVCLCLANKYHVDIPFDNKSWHKLTLIPAKDFNEIELQVLKLLDFNLGMSSTELDMIKAAIEAASYPENNNLRVQ